MTNIINKGFSIKCGNCGHLVKIPIDYSQKSGKCPKCGGTIVVPHKNSTPIVKLIEIPSDIHPLVYITGKYRSEISDYGKDLQKIYDLIKKGFVHKDEYEKQKKILKKNAFIPAIKDAARLPDFSFDLKKRIDIWQLVLTLLPMTFPENETDFIYNLYPRYDYATLLSLAYIFGGLADYSLKREIIRKGVMGEKNTPRMQTIFKDLLISEYKSELIKRSKALMEETKKTIELAPVGMEKQYFQIEEDFNYGISWIGFHLP